MLQEVKQLLYGHILCKYQSQDLKIYYCVCMYVFLCVSIIRLPSGEILE